MPPTSGHRTAKAPTWPCRAAPNSAGPALAAHPGDAETALTAHEQAMFPRAAAAEADDAGFYPIVIDDRAPHGLLVLMTGAVPAAPLPGRPRGTEERGP